MMRYDPEAARQQAVIDVARVQRDIDRAHVFETLFAFLRVIWVLARRELRAANFKNN